MAGLGRRVFWFRERVQNSPPEPEYESIGPSALDGGFILLDPAAPLSEEDRVALADATFQEAKKLWPDLTREQFDKACQLVTSSWHEQTPSEQLMLADAINQVTSGQ